MMKMLIPIIKVQEILPLLKAGADEFYFGLDLNKQTNDGNCLNLMPIHYANLRKISEAKQAIKIVRKHHKSLYLCFNNEFYLSHQYKIIHRILNELEGLNGVIISEPMLIREIHKLFPHLEITVSTRANIFNSSTLEYFISLGAKRFVFPRHLYLKDLIGMLKNYNKYKFEVFMKNENCPYINGFCTYTHNIWCDENEIHRYLFCRGEEWSRENITVKINDRLVQKGAPVGFKKRLMAKNCGVCSLFDLYEFGRSNVILKLTSRVAPLSEKLKDAKFLKTAIRILPKFGSKSEYRNKIKSLYKQIYSSDCDNQCFYSY